MQSVPSYAVHSLVFSHSFISSHSDSLEFVNTRPFGQPQYQPLDLESSLVCSSQTHSKPGLHGGIRLLLHSVAFVQCSPSPSNPYSQVSVVLTHHKFKLTLCLQRLQWPKSLSENETFLQDRCNRKNPDN